MEQIQCTCTKCKHQMQREVLYVYVPQQRDAVITSYSIHYTKLYEIRFFCITHSYRLSSCIEVPGDQIEPDIIRAVIYYYRRRKRDIKWNIGWYRQRKIYDQRR